MKYYFSANFKRHKMATTHVFIVDSNTFKYHLEYLFAGTGAGEAYIDFNNTYYTHLHYATENNLVGMIADGERIRVGDYVIFYLQQNFSQGIREGKFYGIFRVKSRLFLDNNDNNQFLKFELQKSLTFRILIEPFEVYPEGVTEWEALDEIRNIQSPNQMLWSLIYRKLKGNRGNTMITIYESERLFQLIRNKNQNNQLNCDNFTFDINSQKIICNNTRYEYTGRMEQLNLLPRLVEKYRRGLQFETHLQAYILKNLERIFPTENIEWIGNEVACGVGMQRIDIMFSSVINEVSRKVSPIELKSTFAYPEITIQLQRYIDWLEQYYIPNRPSRIEPMIISRFIPDKNSQDYLDLIIAFRDFNQRNGLNIKYIEFSIDIENIAINFKEVEY
jgi:predicted RNA-binding protein